MARSNRWTCVVICLLVLVAFLVGARHLDTQSMWRDEVDAVRFSQAPVEGLLTNLTRPGWNGPLYFLVLRGWIGSTGESPYAVRFFSLLAGVLCIPLTYVVGRRLLGRTTAVIGAVLVATSPYLAWYSLEAKMYSWVTALTLLAVYALRRGFDEGNRTWWAAHVVASSLALYSHIISALLIPVQVTMFLVWAPRKRRQWMGGIVAFSLLLLPYLPLLGWQAPLLFQRRATGFAPLRVGEILAILVTAWSVGPYPARAWLQALPKILAGLVAWSLALVVLLAASRGSRSAGNGRRARAALSLGVWAALPAVVLGVISFWQPIFTDRYLVWSAPAFFLLVALGISALGRLWSPARPLVAAAALLLLTINLLGSQLQLAGGQKADFRSAARFVATFGEPDLGSVPIASPNELVVRTFLPMVVASGTAEGTEQDLIIFQIPHSRHAFEFYYRGYPYTPADGPFANHRAGDGGYLMSEHDLSRIMDEMTAGHSSVWLIATEVGSWDERRLTEEWLHANLRLELIAHFAHIDVHLYSRREPS